MEVPDHWARAPGDLEDPCLGRKGRCHRGRVGWIEDFRVGVPCELELALWQFVYGGGSFSKKERGSDLVKMIRPIIQIDLNRGSDLE